MKYRLLVLFLLIAGGVGSGYSQRVQPPDALTTSQDAARAIAAEQRRQAERDRQSELTGLARLRSVTEAKNDGTLVRDSRGRQVGYSPTLTEEDIRAIEVPAEDRAAYADLLKSPKTGILRLQNADVCRPNDLIIQANAGCPNNVTGKGTAYSFRTGDYRSSILADIFYQGRRLAGRGAYTIGVLADLGAAQIDLLTAKSDGVRQLVAFQPPTDPKEYDRQHSILTRGILIGGFRYSTRVEAAEGNSYVLRSVAYRGKLMRGEKPRQVNVLSGDDRGDVTLVFRIVRQMADGSIVLVWKELRRADPPKVVLDATTDRKPAATNKYATLSDR